MSFLWIAVRIIQFALLSAHGIDVMQAGPDRWQTRIPQPLHSSPTFGEKFNTARVSIALLCVSPWCVASNSGHQMAAD